MTRHSPLRGLGFWVRLDAFAHHLPLPGRVQDWVCSQADRSLVGDTWIKSESVNPQPQRRESDPDARQ